MSKTKLPSECTTSASPTCSAPCTQCGWPPTTRSAPAPTSARATSCWTGSGRCVYCVPQCGITTTTSARRCSRRTSARTRASSRRSSGPVRGGMLTDSAPGWSGSGLGGLADRVEPEEPEAHAVPLDHHRRPAPPPGRARRRTVGRPLSRSSSTVVDEGLRRRSRRCGCWPGRSRRTRRAAGRARTSGGAWNGSPTWVGGPAPRERALEVADGDVGGGEPVGHRRQRRAPGHAAAEHDVADDRQRRDRSGRGALRPGSGTPRGRAAGRPHRRSPPARPGRPRRPPPRRRCPSAGGRAGR